MKNAQVIFLIFLCNIFTSNHAMETSKAPLSLLNLPIDVLVPIFRLSFPMTNNVAPRNTKGIATSEEKLKEKFLQEKLCGLAAAIINLRCINKVCNAIITQKITDILQHNKDTINQFLVRSTQANIPYFIKVAVNDKNVNINCISNRGDGNTPLLNATSANCYLACKLLLEKGAAVNMHQGNQSFGFGGPPVLFETPILRATRNGNAQLITLFTQNKANLGAQVNCGQESSLLSVAATRINPDILTILLNACPDSDYATTWGLERIEYALAEASKIDVKTYRTPARILADMQEDETKKAEEIQLLEERKQKCIKLLEEAKNKC